MRKFIYKIDLSHLKWVNMYGHPQYESKTTLQQFLNMITRRKIKNILLFVKTLKFFMIYIGLLLS